MRGEVLLLLQLVFLCVVFGSVQTQGRYYIVRIYLGTQLQVVCTLIIDKSMGVRLNTGNTSGVARILKLPGHRSCTLREA